MSTLEEIWFSFFFLIFVCECSISCVYVCISVDGHVYGYECSFVFMTVSIETQVNTGNCPTLHSTLVIVRRSLAEPGVQLV